MPETIGYIQELAGEVGPRPASTEEEHQGAQHIADWFSQRSLDPQIEEFSCPTWADWPYVACYLLAVVATLLASLHGAAGIIALVLALIALGAFAYERYLSGALASRLSKGLSQNVIARYIPPSADRERRRKKIVIIAHYDSERSAIEASSSLIGFYPLIQKIILGCMAAIPLLMIIQMIPAVAGIQQILWIVTCVAAIGPFVAAVCMLIRRFIMRYSTGANDNASGIAAMMTAFEQIVPSEGSTLSPDRAFDAPRRHGARRARAAGVVPDDAELVYERDADGDVTISDATGEMGAVRSAGSSRDFGSAREHVTLPSRAADLNEGAGAVAKSGIEAAMAVESAQAASTVIAGQTLEKTAGTSDAIPRKKFTPIYEPSKESEHRRTERSDVPDWWARVESKRKNALDEDDAAAVIKARSRFADIPSTDFKREDQHEKERLEAEEAAKEALAAAALAKTNHAAVEAMSARVNSGEEQLAGAPSHLPASDFEQVESAPVSAVSSTSRVPLAPVVTVEASQRHDDVEFDDPDSTMPHSPVAAQSAQARPQINVPQVTVQPAAAPLATERDDRQPAAVPSSQSLGETRAMTPVQSEGGARAALSRIPSLDDDTRATTQDKSSLNRKLAHLPSIEGDNSFAGLDTTGDGIPVVKGAAPAISSVSEPAFLDDDDFGMSQPAPISSSYESTPQAGAYNDFSGSGNLEPVVTRIDDSDSNSPLRAGTFAAGETGAFVPISATGSFKLDDDESDLFVADADDSTLASAPAGGEFESPGGIDMPDSRTHRLLDNVSGFFSRDKKKKKADKAINEWLDVDEDFEATSAGREIGSWDNFDDSAPQRKATTKGDYLTDDDDFDWKGGGAAVDDDGSPEQASRVRNAVLSQSNADLLNKEVWFVALGASGADHAGIKAFLANHQHELTGATFINLECVGAGELSYLECEGIGFTRTADHRLQGLIHRIGRESGIDVVGRKLDWRTTDLTTALKAGFRGVTLMAFDKTAPVAWRQKTDNIDIIEESCIEEAAGLTVEIVRNS